MTFFNLKAWIKILKKVPEVWCNERYLFRFIHA